MKRKLVQMGEHTLMSAIPSKWIKRHNLKKGDYVEFNEVENKLVLTSTAEIYERKTEIILVSDKMTEIWRVVVPTYTSGYDEVKINYSKPGALKIIERSVDLLVGFEIVETNPKYVIVKSISKQLDGEFDVILKRMWYVAKQMVDILLEFFQNGDKKRLQEIYALEQTTNKYAMFLRRIINRTGYKFPHYTYQLISFLELAVNHIEYIRRYYDSNLKIRIDKEAAKDFVKLHDLWNMVYDLHYNYSGEKFRVISDMIPHFLWFDKIKDSRILFEFKAMAEYLMQISRQIEALHV